MSLPRAVLSGTGLFTPPHAISNEELVATFNQYVAAFNAQHAAEISDGRIEALAESSSEFIEKASGIKSRFVLDKAGILNPDIMRPQFARRSNDELSLQAEIGVAAARQALENAAVAAADIDMVLVANSNMQRAYPAMAVEIQTALGCGGFAFDMNVACSSATFALQTAADAVKSGSATRVLIVNAEICSAHMNFRDRDSHFIFGDAATAMVVEREDLAAAGKGFEIAGTKLWTQFSNNIRNNFGFLNRCETDADPLAADKLFVQQGRKVFKEVCPAVGEHIVAHLAAHQIEPQQVARFWLHQANRTMNELISRRVLGRDAAPEEAPMILDRYANTSSAGSVIALHLHQDNLAAGSIGVLSSFGAGYSIGSVVLVKR
ncbi:beta-ketoacyl-ACP synthase III [Uruburuella testudinis]|uniref:Beta-ketoacyl-ACP synthase III n=1 Tax=Uruburuella testudinis TaxID=1282863 RepID=A0ABY4DRE6_9NEIS|nr:beta-ketoacyl-ACP synthase III [Uruburuella testudinis]UOO81461.1 beta-ketoacyl-ACP synthase III [Uruburuella testudinis]